MNFILSSSSCPLAPSYNIIYIPIVVGGGGYRYDDVDLKMGQ